MTEALEYTGCAKLRSKKYLLAKFRYLTYSNK